MKSKAAWGLHKKIIFCIIINLVFTVFIVQDSFASVEITSYTYYRYGGDSDDYYPVPAPCPYNYVGSIYAEDLNVDNLRKLTSLCVSDDYVYISSGNKIIITDHNFETQHVIDSIVDNNGQRQDLTDISGLWVTDDGELYACEPNKGRILQFTKEWKLERILGRPDGLIISENVSYQPLKVAVDSVGRIYVVANNIYEGLVEINPDGTFSRYFGKVEIKYTPVQLFWRMIQTQAQRARSAEWLPVNFSNITIDKDDFVYATVAGSNEDKPIRKLNAKGNNILRYPASTDIAPQGDLYINRYGLTVPTGKSILTAIDINDYGIYIVLDSKRSRVFAYDDDGYMLYAFGESGTTKGRLQMPVDVKFMGDDKLLIADRGNMSIEVYELNEYGRHIHNAVKYQAQSDYRAAAEEWKKVVDYNPSFQYAYVGIGKALYRDGDHDKAQQYFLLGQDVDYYSKAFRKTRQEFISDNFSLFAIIVVAIVMGIAVCKTVRYIKFKNGAVK